MAYVIKLLAHKNAYCFFILVYKQGYNGNRQCIRPCHSRHVSLPRKLDRISVKNRLSSSLSFKPPIFQQQTLISVNCLLEVLFCFMVLMKTKENKKKNYTTKLNSNQLNTKKQIKCAAESFRLMQHTINLDVKLKHNYFFKSIWKLKTKLIAD